MTRLGHTMSSRVLPVQLRNWRASRRSVARRRSEFKPMAESLEGRDLPAAAVACSALQQVGVPSVFAIGSTGNVSYNFLAVVNGAAQLHRLVASSRRSRGDVDLERDGAFAAGIDSAAVCVHGEYAPRTSTTTRSTAVANFNGWTPVGINVGAVSISTGTLPITNTPFVVMINANDDVYYNSQLNDGVWTGWTPVGVNVGAVVDLDRSHPDIARADVLRAVRLHDEHGTERLLQGQANERLVEQLVAGGHWRRCRVDLRDHDRQQARRLDAEHGREHLYQFAEPRRDRGWAGRRWAPEPGQGQRRLIASPAIVSSFNNYEFALNPSGQLYSTFGIYGRWSCVDWSGKPRRRAWLRSHSRPRPRLQAHRSPSQSAPTAMCTGPIRRAGRRGARSRALGAPN